MARERAILEEAQERAARILSKAGQEAQALHREADQRKGELASRFSAREEAGKKISARKRLLHAQDAGISALRGACRSHYRQFMNTPSYLFFLALEMEKVKGEMGPPGEIRADPKTASCLRAIGVEGIIVEETGLDGFVAVDGEGRRRMYCTFDSRLEKLWKR
ncbi:MAG: hypothetical protein HYU64_21125, partial [Armatimonadetes bacterium]|nr:hypothetical protein [Armatimonadota bacterium]